MTAPGKLTEGLTERVVKLLGIRNLFVPGYGAHDLGLASWVRSPPSWSPTCLPLRWA